jgi:hypothetical protein
LIFQGVRPAAPPFWESCFRCAVSATDTRCATIHTQARAWQSLAQNCACRFDQLAGRRAALAALEGQPLLRVDYLLETAEWLAAGGDGPGATMPPAQGGGPRPPLLGAAAAGDPCGAGAPIAEALLLEAAGILVDDDSLLPPEGDADRQPGAGGDAGNGGSARFMLAKAAAAAAAGTARSARQAARSAAAREVCTKPKAILIDARVL